MPKFPSYERRAGISGGSTASYASEGAFTAPARALANMGGAVADLGADIQAGEQKIRNTQSDAWLSKARAETALEMQALERDMQQSATEGAKDFTPTAQARYEELRKAKLAQAPSPRAAQAYQSWSDGFGVDVVGRASRFQAESELAKRTSDFADAMTAHAQVIYADPTQYEAVAKRAMDDFAGAKQWMTPEQETAAREKVDHDLKLARAKSLVEFSPADFMAEVGVQEISSLSGGAAVNAVVDRIIGVESGGRANAKNPNSSASGLGQFIDSTWLATIRKHRPDIAAGKSSGELLAMKNDPVLGREMTAAYTQDNAEFLGNRGIQATPGNLYLAHFLGPFGAVQALKADGGASVASVLGGDVVRANSFLAGMSINDLRAWSAKKMGGKTSPQFASNPRYAGLSVDEIRSLSNQAETAVNAQQVTAYTSMKDAMDLGIADGSILSEDQILGSALNDGDKATFLRRFRSERKDEIAAMETIASLNARTFEGDPYDSDTRKNIDNVAGILKKQATPEQYQLAAEEITRQSGIVPKDVVNAIRKGLESKSPAEVAAAAHQANRLSQIDPAALGRRDGGKEAQNAADDFAHMVNNLNMTPEEAGKRIMDMNDPEKKRERKAIEPAAKEFIKEMQDFSLANEFDTAFGAEPSVGFGPGQELGIKAEFLAIAEEQFYAANGDPEIAQNRAVEQMKRIYGVTELTGRKVLMKHPPEKHWPLLRIQKYGETSVVGDTPSLDYATIQLQRDLRELEPNVDMGSVQLVTTPETDAMVKRGEMPGYAVLYKDADGVLQTIPGKLWRPDPKADVERQGTIEDAERAEDAGRVDEARKEQAHQRQQAPFKVQKQDDFLSGNDPAFGAR